jgi:hypothetical protein
MRKINITIIIEDKKKKNILISIYLYFIIF